MSVKMMLAVASAAVIGLSAQADPVMSTWFDAKIGSYTEWPLTSQTDLGGEWSGAGGATLSGEAPSAKLVIDTDDATPLCFTAATEKSLDVGIVEIVSTLSFVPFAADAIPQVDAEAKAGVIAVKTGDDAYAFYGLKKVNAENAWVPLSGFAPTTLADLDDVTVKVVFKKSGDDAIVNYTLNDNLMTDGVSSDLEIIADGNVSVASFLGSGELSRLESKAEIPMGTLTLTALTGLDYAVVSNMTAGTEIDVSSGSAQIPQGNAVRIFFAPKAGKVLTGASYLDIASMGAAVEINDATAGLPTVEDGKVQNGTQYYLTLRDAILNMKSGETVTLLEDVTGDGAQGPDGTDVSYCINLNGHTFTYAQGAGNLLQFLNGSTVVISNGTIACSAATETWNLKALVRSYATSMTLKDVTLDATNVKTEDTAGRDNYRGAIMVTNGDLTLAGKTSITNTESDVYALNWGCYPSTYTMGTLTIDSTGTLSGKYMFAGGEVKALQDSFADDAEFYIGANAFSYYTDATLSGSVFAARVGGVPTAGTGESYKMNVTGRLYKSFAAAQAALTTTTYEKTLALLQATTLAEGTTIAAGTTYDIATGSLTVPAETTLTLSGTLKCSATGDNFVNSGTLAIAAGATVYMGDVKWFGADGVFANVTAGSLAQTRSQTKYGNTYVISADGRATIVADATLFNAYDDEYFLSDGAEVTVPNVDEATVKARFNPVDSTKSILVKNSNVYYVGTASEPFVPGDEKTYDTLAEAEAASNKFVVAISPAVETKLADDQAKSDYKAMFRPVIVEEGGKFVLKADFTEAAAQTVQTAVDAATAAIEVATIAAAAGASDIVIPSSIPGLYYQLNTASSLGDGAFDVAAEVIGDGQAVTFEGVAKPSAEAGFYKVSVTAAPVITNF